MHGRWPQKGASRKQLHKLNTSDVLRYRSKAVSLEIQASMREMMAMWQSPPGKRPGQVRGQKGIAIWMKTQSAVSFLMLVSKHGICVKCPLAAPLCESVVARKQSCGLCCSRVIVPCWCLLMHVLVTICPVLSSCCDQSFQRSVLIADAAAHRERLATLGKAKLLSPSSYGKPTGDESWSAPKVQSLQEAMCHHRPARTSEEQPTPVVLFDPILAQLAQDCEFAKPSKAIASLPQKFQRPCQRPLSTRPFAGMLSGPCCEKSFV